MEKATVTNIQGYSIHDGPGIRTVVFIKGCPLRCRWCANPENLDSRPQTGFIAALCAGCGECLQVCKHGSIIPGEEVYRIDRERCVGCGSCVDACFYGALVRYGSEMTSEEAFSKVRRDKMFYDSSGGGVTISGGEPLTRVGFVRELFELCVGEEINTCIETCGCIPTEAIELVAPLTDLFLYDLKFADSEEHNKFTGAGNKLILENARRLVSMGSKVLFRQPLIPGVNDGDSCIEAIAAFMRSLGEGGRELQLMPYHRMGKSKYDALRLQYGMEDTPIMTEAEIAAVKGKYIALGISCSVSQ